MTQSDEEIYGWEACHEWGQINGYNLSKEHNLIFWSCWRAAIKYKGKRDRDYWRNNRSSLAPLCPPEGHVWIVHDLDHENNAIRVKCLHCSTHGLIRNATVEEWEKAHGAHLEPYKWHHNHLVDIS